MIKKHLHKFNIIRIIFSLLFLLSVGKLFYRSISKTTGLEILIWLPTAILLFALALFTPSKTISKYSRDVMSNSIQLLIGLSLTITSIWLLNKSRNNSDVIFQVKYFNEASLYIEFRENMTFKARESNMFDSEIVYGNYEINDSILILSNAVRFGNAKLNDSLTINKQGIKFELESTYRNINQGIMKFK